MHTGFEGSSRSSSLALFVTLLTILLATGCGGGGATQTPTPTPAPIPTPTPSASLQSITVTSSAPTVALGLTDQFAASGVFSDGTSKPLPAVAWTVSDSTKATINASGLLTAKAQGSVTVTATSGTVSGSTTATVGPPTVTGFSITPSTASATIGAAPANFAAVQTFSDQSTVDVTSQAQWNVSNSFVATVDTTGTAIPNRPGFSRVMASFGGQSASADFTALGTPRYFYTTGEAGRLITRTNIDVSTGLPRFEGYQRTGQSSSTALECLTLDPFNQFAYMVSSFIGVNPPSPGEISQFTVDPASGSLTAVAGSPFSTTLPEGCIQFEPAGKFAYGISTLGSSPNKLVTYSRDAATGVLTEIASMDIPTAAANLAIDPRGQYLYFTTIFLGVGTQSQIFGFSIDTSTGALAPVAGTPLIVPNNSGPISIAPSGDFLFLSSDTDITTFSVDPATGKIAALSRVVPSSCINVSRLVFAPSGKTAYANCASDASLDLKTANVVSLAVAANGTVTQLGSASNTGIPSGWLLVDPSGKFAYAGSITTPLARVFQIDATGVARSTRQFGKLQNNFSAVILGGTAPVKPTTNFAFVNSSVDPTSPGQILAYPVQNDGTFGVPSFTSAAPGSYSLSTLPWGSDLLAANSAVQVNLASYDITGGVFSLASVFGEALTAGSVIIDPSGNAAFETDSAQGVVYTFARDTLANVWGPLNFVSSSGAPITNVAAGAGAGPMAVDPVGDFLYVGNRTSNNISAYHYDGPFPELLETTSAITAPHPDGSPFALGASPVQFAIDPLGAFLYVICSDHSLHVFSIDYAAFGYLAPIATVALTGQPSGVAVDPSGDFLYVAEDTGTQAFQVNLATGALTSVSLGGVGILPGLNGVFIEPSGRFLYLTTSGTPGAVFAFTINNDGTLTQVGNGPVATPDSPSSMTFSATVQ